MMIEYEKANKIHSNWLCKKHPGLKIGNKFLFIKY